MLKKISALLLALVLVLSYGFVKADSASTDIKVFIDNVEVQFDVQPQIINDRTMVPVRAIFSRLGSELSWDGDTNTAYAVKDNIKVAIQIGSDVAQVENFGVSKDVKLDVPAQEIDGRTLVPLRFVSEALGAYVRWDGDTNSAYITANPLKISYIDVGQGDCELIQLNGYNMLIDTGTNASTNSLISYLQAQGISKIDYLILTHPHEDHIGGADAVIKTINVGQVYMPEVTADTKTFESVISAMLDKGLKANKPVPGTEFSLGDANCTIFAPNSTDYEEVNNYSIVIKLTYGNKAFLFTGDAQEESEKEMLLKDYNLKADVLKVGHHGSDTSTGDSFLKAVAPEYAVISVGKDNDYGHPKATTLQKLSNAGVKVYRTDEQGTIVCASDGIEISFNCVPTAIVSADNETDTHDVVYFTPSGKSYHYNTDCPALSRSTTILQGTLQEAIDSGHSDPCDICVH